MNNNCEFCGGGYCLCDACRSMQEAIRKAENVPKEDVDQLFQDAEALLENMKKPEKEGRENGRDKS